MRGIDLARYRRCVAAIIVVFIAFAVMVIPTSRASASTFLLSGSVADTTSQPVVGTAVTAIETTTRVEVDTTTDSAGVFRVALSEGTYDVRFTPPAASELVESTVRN